MKKRTISILLMILLIAAGALSACSNSGGGAADKDTLFVLSSTQSDNLDPYTGLGTDYLVSKAIFSSLVNYGPNGEIIPDVAESWTESEDGMSTTFKLREDVTFHNGDPLTADDVVYTFDTAYASDIFGWLSDDLAYCKKIDDYTVEIGKTTPASLLYENIIEFVYILPKNYRSADEAGFDTAPIGCGPYKFVSKEDDDTVKLEAYDGYFGDEPGFKLVDVKPAIDPANAVISLETGELDLIPFVPATQAQIVESKDGLTLVSRTDGWTMNALLLMGDVFREDPNLRKAVFHAINRESAITLGNEGIGEVPQDMLAARLMGDYAGSVEMVGYDPELAADYLSKSNYNGQTITITISENPALAESILTDLKAIGIETKIEQLDVNDYYTKMYDGNTEITLTSMGSDVMSVPGFLYMFTQEYPWYGGIMVNDPDFDKIVVDAARNVHPKEEADKLAVEGLQKFYDIAEWVPLFEKSGNYSYGPNVVYDYPITAITSVFYLNKVMPNK